MFGTTFSERTTFVSIEFNVECVQLRYAKVSPVSLCVIVAVVWLCYRYNLLRYRSFRDQAANKNSSGHLFLKKQRFNGQGTKNAFQWDVNYAQL